ncbi:NAD(P)-binding domain-containing protein [bacterium]|nr:NAD(P)-binding domain-containing protein [FCB group bacterium]MBL7190743.1 NAD(P)-binding domain-containing protein [bacterium]
MAEEALETLIGEVPEISEDHPLNLARAGVIGAGTMGRGIAQIFAANGIDVIILEKTEESLKNSLRKLSEELDREINRWGMTSSEKRAILSRIRGTTDMEEISEIKLIIEAAPEILSLKKELFTQIDRICREDAILVSNTSALSLSEIAAATAHPEYVIGAHFMNPVPKTKLVEIVRGLSTSDETFEYVKGVAERLDKTVVEVYEYPGYVTTRIILPMLNEAMYVLMEGVSTADGIDTAMKKGYNFPYGPLEFADMLGLDEVMNWMETLFHELGDLKYRPCPFLRKLVRAGHLGKKTGQGFFKYDDMGKRKKED